MDCVAIFKFQASAAMVHISKPKLMHQSYFYGKFANEHDYNTLNNISYKISRATNHLMFEELLCNVGTAWYSFYRVFLAECAFLMMCYEHTKRSMNVKFKYASQNSWTF